jgi:hypothetical protein
MAILGFNVLLFDIETEKEKNVNREIPCNVLLFESRIVKGECINPLNVLTIKYRRRRGGGLLLTSPLSIINDLVWCLSAELQREGINGFVRTVNGDCDLHHG